MIQNTKYWNSADINAILYSTNDFSQIVDSIFIPTLIPRDQLDLSGNDRINIELIPYQ